MARRAGTERVVAEAVERAASPVVPAVQVGLPLAELAPAPKRRPGRQAGSRNRRSEELNRYLLAKYGVHPLEVLFQAFTRPVEALARELATTKLKAAEFQRLCAVEALPYFEGKKPVSIQIDSRAIALHLHGMAGGAGAGAAPWEVPIPGLDDTGGDTVAQIDGERVSDDRD